MESSRFGLLVFTIAILASSALSDLVLSKVDRRIYLTSHIVRISSTLKVENAGPETLSEVLLPFPELQVKNMAYLMATPHEGKGKVKNSVVALPVEAANPKDMPPALSFYSADVQLVVHQESAYYLSPYAVKVQSLSVKLPDSRIESYTKLENTKIHGSEINYDPYENLPAFSYSPIVVHFESNQPFAVAQELVKEVEISHWGNVKVTEHYKLIHGGAQSKGEFSRLDFQARPNVRELLIEPRYPMFGGWRTAFTIGYGLPFQDFLYESEGKRFLNITFSSPMVELVIDTLIVKVYYKFNKLSMLREPLMLISGFFFIFVACIVYMHADISISKSSASYLAKQQWEEVQAAIQLVQNIISWCLTTHDKLEASLRDLSRMGDVQSCKAARKAADDLLKELSKELKPLLAFLQSSPSAAQILPKVEELVAKERELQEKVMVKHSTVVDGYEKKSGARDIENRVALQQQKLIALRQEVDDLLEFIDEI
ncbi:hypothetical protein CRYUN_Cryun27aG0119300 [Craigia yunnanensis]